MTLSRLVEGMLSAGHEIELVRPKQHRFDAGARVDRLEEVLRPGVGMPGYPGLRIGFPSGRALKRRWQLKRPDVVHIATEGPLGWSALNAASTLGIPVSTGFHTNFHTYSSHYGFGLLRRPVLSYLKAFHNRAQVTLVPTQGVQRELEQHGFQRVRILSRGVDTDLFSPGRRNHLLRHSWNADPNTIVALYVGRLAPEKNLDLVMEAFSAMRVRNRKARLVLVGDGPEKTRLAKRFPEAFMAGPRTGIDLAEHYASADMFVFASRSETFGNVTLEAMASGLPVIAFDYAAAREHVLHGHSGLLAPVDDSSAFIAHAASLVAEPQSLPRLGAQARKTAEKVSWKSVLAEFELLLTGVASADSVLQHH
jgi:glycosyltransferase involved in cell wall biosynthesis